MRTCYGFDVLGQRVHVGKTEHADMQRTSMVEVARMREPAS